MSLCSFFIAIVFSVLRFTASDYPFGILDLRLLITPLVSSIFSHPSHVLVRYLDQARKVSGHVYVCERHVYVCERSCVCV